MPLLLAETMRAYRIGDLRDFTQFGARTVPSVFQVGGM